MVPDVSGVDKVFDYAVPDKFASTLGVGDKVRIILNNRRVGGWVVGIERQGDDYTTEPVSRDARRTASFSLSAIQAVSGVGVAPELISLTEEVARRWGGSWRAVLVSASAPKVRLARGTASRRSAMKMHASADEVETLPSGDVLVVSPPSASVMSMVAQCALAGPTLVVCPTIKMAIRGAASLRRRGFTVAVYPDNWSEAFSGVDVVIGPRSAVWAPCPDLSSIVLVDEHDEAHWEERVPTWNSLDVARLRAGEVGARVVATSTFGSLKSRGQFSHVVRVDGDGRWPRVDVVDLLDPEMTGGLRSNLLTRPLLAALENASGNNSTTVLVLNAKGRARLLACASCATIQRCEHCGAVVSQNDDQSLHCPRCEALRAGLCQECGRTSFRNVRLGSTNVREQLAASAKGNVVDLAGHEPGRGDVVVDTEAALHRVEETSTVCFLDIDIELESGRLDATSTTLSMVSRAARLVGPKGRIVIQTREPSHPILEALVSGSVDAALNAELAMRRTLDLPPFSLVVEATGAVEVLDQVQLPLGCSSANISRDRVMLRFTEVAVMRSVLDLIKATAGRGIRLAVEPYRQ